MSVGCGGEMTLEVGRMIVDAEEARSVKCSFRSSWSNLSMVQGP